MYAIKIIDICEKEKLYSKKGLMLEWIQVQRPLSVKGFFQCFLTIERLIPCSWPRPYLLGLLADTLQIEERAVSAFTSPSYSSRSGGCCSPGQAPGHLRYRWILVLSAGCNLIAAQLQVCASACGLPSSSGNSMASINKCWQTTCFANPFTGLLLMLSLGIPSSAVLSPPRSLIGFFSPV